MPISVRPATADDQNGIVALVRSDRLKPTGLSWSNFVVAVDGPELVGAAQIRKHKDGSLELGSLVVARNRRGRGVAVRVVNRLLASEPRGVFAITGQARTAAVARWGFQPIKPRQAPFAIKFNYYLGYFGGGMISLLLRRPVNRLVILQRPPLHGVERRKPATEDGIALARLLQIQAAQWPS
jgi:amino-acid N-acetyltransferase